MLGPSQRYERVSGAGNENSNFLNTISDKFRSLKTCPKELYVNFVLKFLESYSYFAVSQILVLYLHSEFGFSDIEAGIMYGLWGIAITFWGLVASGFNDLLGVRQSLLIGLSTSLFSTFALASVRSRTWLYIVLFAMYPIGTAMGIPMLTVGIRRYTNELNRGFAFGLYYSVMNIAAFVSGPVIDYFFVYFDGGAILTGTQFSPNRLVILTTTLTSFLSVITTFFFLREVKVPEQFEESNIASSGVFSTSGGKGALRSNTTLDDSQTNGIYVQDEIICSDVDLESRPHSTLDESQTTKELPIYIEIIKSATFRRFIVFSLLLINLNAVFRHLDATLPTFLMRCFGEKVPKGTIYSINPFIIIFLAPLVSALSTNYANYDMIKFGGYITGISPFFLACSTSIWATICFVVLLSIGEAFWSPRIYSYTMSIAPEGREASFSALASAPLFAAKVPVGLLSGYLLSTYVPENGPRNPQMMWLTIALLTMSSPVLITLLEKFIREPSAEVHGADIVSALYLTKDAFVIDEDDDFNDDLSEEYKYGLELDMAQPSGYLKSSSIEDYLRDDSEMPLALDEEDLVVCTESPRNDPALTFLFEGVTGVNSCGTTTTSRSVIICSEEERSGAHEVHAGSELQVIQEDINVQI